MERILSKPGKYGTLHLYRVHYDERFPGSGFGGDDWHTFAYNEQDAHDKFYDSSEDQEGDGFVVKTVERVRHTQARRSR